MNKQTEKLKSNKKQQYSRPTLRVIELVTDEVLGSGCKAVTDVSPMGLCGTTACGSQIGS